ncbi:hypothetical protein, partial [Acidiluteibacter ferrifornacis]
MELHHYFFFTLLSVAFVASGHAANLSPEEYWKVKLPNTPMPRPIKDALQYSVAGRGWYQPATKGDLKKLRLPFGVDGRGWYQPATEGDLKKLRQPFGWLYAANEGDLQPKLFNSATEKDINENHLVTPYFFETD